MNCSRRWRLWPSAQCKHQALGGVITVTGRSCYCTLASPLYGRRNDGGKFLMWSSRKWDVEILWTLHDQSNKASILTWKWIIQRTVVSDLSLYLLVEHFSLSWCCFNQKPLSTFPPFPPVCMHWRGDTRCNYLLCVTRAQRPFHHQQGGAAVCACASCRLGGPQGGCHMHLEGRYSQ